MTGRVWAVALAAAVLGAVGGAMWIDDRGSGRGAANGAARDDAASRAELAALVDEVAALREALDAERSQRGALEIELALLREAIEGASTDGALPEAGAPAAKPETPEDGSPSARSWFDVEVLRDHGLDAARAERLRAKFDALQMEELYLRDDATREGYLNRPRHRDQLRALHAAAREELGSADYDWLLYASGRNNRVLVEDVLAGSPAEAAGIRPGDLVLRYDDVAILSPRELNRTTAEGESGATVAVDLQRDGDVQRVYVKRGPLGTRIRWVRRAPLAGP